MPRLLLAAAALLSVLASGACTGEAPADDTSEAETISKKRGAVRVVAANLTSGTQQSYDPGHGLRILRALAPDVVLLQELNYGDNGDAAMRAFAEAAMGPGVEIFREEEASIPNGIASRFPIVERGEWADPGSSGTRDYAWARIDVPGEHDLFAVSVHFKAKADQIETRDSQARTLLEALGSKARPGDFVVVGGDLNTEAADEPCMKTLGAVVDVEGPYPADPDGNPNTSTNRNSPYDWVLASPELRRREVAVKIGGATFEAGLVVDTRTYPRIEDLAPAERDDSAAPGMQHMAVVRDFALR